MSPDEQSILAYFPSSTKAESAVEALKAEGVSESRIDSVGRFGVETDIELNNPISGEETQTGLSLYSADMDQFNDNDQRALKAADPSVSGMAARDYGVAGGERFLVSMVVSKDKTEKALKILRGKGGQV